MGPALLPWEKWLPPWLIGPFLVIAGIGMLISDKHLAWWEWVLLPIGMIYGAWGTWVWFTTQRNIFKEDGSKPPKE
ncbi:hypothetical protein ACO0LD_12755 [Undibacterium sp. Ji83W]|uniref:hypothetical protein n=1 Tax=Undibacterium sp. Ji83W TaxID=3413043 RepID=UPI003BF3B06F